MMKTFFDSETCIMRIKKFHKQSWNSVLTGMLLLLLLCGMALFILRVEARSLIDNPKPTPGLRV